MQSIKHEVIFSSSFEAILLMRLVYVSALFSFVQEGHVLCTDLQTDRSVL